uniref:Uncharacterized protein n=1 Tax=Oryza rufipogon TaxID=4529 RepID=A0A0E0NLU6_ORYRU
MATPGRRRHGRGRRRRWTWTWTGVGSGRSGGDGDEDGDGNMKLQRGRRAGLRYSAREARVGGAEEGEARIYFVSKKEEEEEEEKHSIKKRAGSADTVYFSGLNGMRVYVLSGLLRFFNVIKSDHPTDDMKQEIST